MRWPVVKNANPAEGWEEIPLSFAKESTTKSNTLYKVSIVYPYRGVVWCMESVVAYVASRRSIARFSKLWAVFWRGTHILSAYTPENPVIWRMTWQTLYLLTFLKRSASKLMLKAVAERTERYAVPELLQTHKSFLLTRMQGTLKQSHYAMQKQLHF